MSSNQSDTPPRPAMEEIRRREQEAVGGSFGIGCRSRWRWRRNRRTQGRTGDSMTIPHQSPHMAAVEKAKRELADRIADLELERAEMFERIAYVDKMLRMLKSGDDA